MAMTMARYPVAPTITPRKGTLLDAATVEEGIEWLDGNDLFESYNCMSFGAAVEFCAPNPKVLDQTPNWADGILFGAYGGLKCRTVGLDINDAKQQIGRVFDAGESTAVERALMETRFAADTDPAARWGAATDVTPAAGAVKPAVGVAMLEGYAASVYAGAPTLHLPITVASLLAGVDGIVAEGDSLRTKVGSKVAAGAGYDYPNAGPTGAAPAVGELWLYATGEVLVQRGEMVLREAIAHEENDVYVLAERPYIASVDCFTAAIRVTVTA